MLELMGKDFHIEEFISLFVRVQSIFYSREKKGSWFITRSPELAAPKEAL
jgi:hypothetical protein